MSTVLESRILLRRIVFDRWFALADLFLVILSGLLWIFKPGIGVLPVMTLALAPWVVRSIAGEFPFKRTSIGWLAALFLVTAWVGYWAAYDKEAAWSKFWLINLSVLLYYALAGQPLENLKWVCIFFFCIGVGVSIYFFLTHDFVADPRKVEFVNRVGLWLTEVRPKLGWAPIHPNYVAGIAAVMTPFVLYPFRRWLKNVNGLSTLFLVFFLVGSGVALLAILMATSRGVIMAIASAFGVWILSWIVDLNGSRLQVRREALFPALAFICLSAVVLFLYIGPANSGSSISTDHSYGTGTRAEVFVRSFDLLLDFPFTGGGLDAFPGLYSQYMLGIPIFYIINSHNLFLDVAIEQGVLGGLSFLVIFLISIWFTARIITKTDSRRIRSLSWLALFALIIAFVHGMVDDYLYNGSGTVLSLALAGFSSALQPETERVAHRRNFHITSFVFAGLIIASMIKVNQFRSTWYADLGAVQMAKVELVGFPTNTWTESTILPDLETAEVSLLTTLRFDPTNRTANHRLGLIYMLRQDFDKACAYLETAHKESPGHRGIVKSLGYCYVWLGEMGKARIFLSQIPEAKSELEVYVWWWETQGRADLSQKASMMVSQIE